MNLLKSWGFMRVLRFVFGAFALVQALITLDIVLGILGLVVGGMAFLMLVAVELMAAKQITRRIILPNK
ncbi:MAG: hypothetical protein IPL10_15530 [Bacteroidetes bacterium]|nr:hypothetical protein [Bacteroidota bacterium]